IHVLRWHVLLHLLRFISHKHSTRTLAQLANIANCGSSYLAVSLHAVEEKLVQGTRRVSGRGICLRLQPRWWMTQPQRFCFVNTSMPGERGRALAVDKAAAPSMLNERFARMVHPGFVWIWYDFVFWMGFPCRIENCTRRFLD
ncbi:MAG: hypothetical protein ACK5L2_18885, partial [Planctomyces sp.]